jgi:hypothetical protein
VNPEPREFLRVFLRDFLGILGNRVVSGDWSAAGWQEMLSFADRTHLTGHLDQVEGLPSWVEEQVKERLRKNALRRKRLEDAYWELAAELNSGSIPFVLLKGFTHETGFGLPRGARAQSDLDILVRAVDRSRASSALQALGYRPHGPPRLSAEHESPWVRPFDWTWRGDYYDPEMPIPVELHSAVWSPQSDRIECPGLDEFWDRRGPMEVTGLTVPAFREIDRVAFAALHALRHILRNDARPAHVFELARLLETRREDLDLWNQWRIVHHPPVRQLQTAAFYFAREWFGCRLPAAVADECEKLPDTITSWLRSYAWSPIDNLTRPNKDVLWLHLALLETRRDRWSVALQRLLPLKAPHDAFTSRAKYHASALVPALREGVRWRWRRTASSTVPHTSD